MIEWACGREDLRRPVCIDQAAAESIEGCECRMVGVGEDRRPRRHEKRAFMLCWILQITVGFGRCYVALPQCSVPNGDGQT